VRTFTGATWVRSSSGSEYLLLRSERSSGGNWLYTYSVYPGTTLTLVTVPGPGTPGPADTVIADMIDQLTGRIK
jgi:hypothetical protein